MALDLTKKAGPLPRWGWGAILLGAALLWSLARAKASSKQQADATPQGPDEVPSDQVPDFISQVYTTVNNPGPPAAPGPPGESFTPGPILTAPPIVGRPVAPAPTPPAPTAPGRSKSGVVEYRVKHGDTLSSIAKRYGTTWQALWKYNTTAGNRPASTIAVLKKRGPNQLVTNQLILIPQK